jgi:hypothetical protein
MHPQASTASPTRPTISLKSRGARVRLADEFLVWGKAPRCKRPSVRYAVQVDAQAEAARLSAIYPGEVFEVYRITLCDRALNGAV